MLKKFKKNRVFPNNWSNLSQEQVLENIRYLLENYKKHKIVKKEYANRINVKTK